MPGLGGFSPLFSYPRYAPPPWFPIPSTSYPHFSSWVPLHNPFPASTFPIPPPLCPSLSPGFPFPSLLPGTPILPPHPSSASTPPPPERAWRRLRTLGIPAAGQHADGFAGPRKVLQELSKGALAVGGNVVGHGEKSGDCAEPGAQQAVCPARARLITTAPRARRSPMGGPRPTQAAGPGRGTAGGGALQWEGRSGARPRKEGGHLRLGGIAAEARALRARGGVYGGGRCIAEGEQLRQEGGRAPQGAEH